MPESVFRLFGDDLNPIFQQNHQNFGSHHCHKSTRSLTNYIDFPKIGSCVDFQIGDIEICNGRIDFKFSLKQCSYILVCGKNTFGAIAGYQKGANNFALFFLQRMQDPSAHLYGDGDVLYMYVYCTCTCTVHVHVLYTYVYCTCFVFT